MTTRYTQEQLLGWAGAFDENRLPTGRQLKFFADVLRRAADDAEKISVTRFICHLIDHHEGEVITEEKLQAFLAEAIDAARKETT